MLTESKLLSHLKKLKLPADGVAYVLRAHRSDPERKVQSNSVLNSPVLYANSDIGVVIQAESSTGEVVEVIESAFDSEGVLEILDQIPKIHFIGTRADGVKFRSRTIADYLKVCRDGVFAVEVKSDKELKRLCRRRPKDWVYKDGVYHNLPAERTYKALGIQYVVRPVSSYDQLRAENLLLLMQARKAPKDKHLAKIRERAFVILKKLQVSTLAELSSALKIKNLTPLLHLILSKDLIVNLTKSRLSQPEGAWVALRADHLLAIETVNEHLFPDLPRNTSISTRDALRPEAAASAASNLVRLKLGIQPGTSDRTLRRLRKYLKDSGGDPAGLRFKYWEWERPKTLLDPKHESFIKRIIKKWFGTAQAPTPGAVHRMYLLAFPKTRLAKNGETPVAYNTFVSRLEMMPQAELGRARGGRRLANSAEAPVDPHVRGLRASRPFQKGHMDHYLCDLWVIVARTGKETYVARPTLTLLWDEYTKEVLGFALAFGAPSRRSDSNVLRDCVRRHGRLPEWIVVDQGSDFRSVFFETWLAEHEITKQERPTSAPRFGGGLERTLGVAKTELYGTLPGNSVNKKIIRSVSPSHRPQQTAALSLYDVYKKTEDYFFRFYNQHPRGTATKAPSILRKEGLERYSCSGVRIHYDLEFIISTALPAPSSSYPIDRARGIRIYDKWYRCPALTALPSERVHGVRLEHWNDLVAYIPINGKWHVAHNQSANESTRGNQILRMCESITKRTAPNLFKELKHARDMELAHLTKQNAIFAAKTSTGHTTRASANLRSGNRPPSINLSSTKVVKPLPVKFRSVA